MVKRYLGIGAVAVFAALVACGTDSDSTGDCTTLPSCCSQLTNASSEAECEAVVKAGDDSSCGDAQSDFVGSTVAGSKCIMATSSPSTPTGCAGLTACCAQITNVTSETACDEVVSAGNDATCTTELTTYESIGASAGGCNAPVVMTTVSGCAALTACCAEITNATDQSTCEEELAAAAGSDTTCESTLTVYESAALCAASSTSGSGSSTDGTGCSALSDCCAKMSSTEQASCDTVVSEGDATVCTEELSVYIDSNACGGSTITSGSGSSTTDGCSSLSSCCSSLPSAEQSGCEEVVSLNNASECSATLMEYESDSLCN